MGVALKLAFFVSLVNTILAYLLILREGQFACQPTTRFYFLVSLSQAQAAIYLTDVYNHQLKGRYRNCKHVCGGVRKQCKEDLLHLNYLL